MNTRMLPTLVLAGVLILAVLGVTAWLTISSPPSERYSAQDSWSQAYSVVQSMKVIDLTGDGKDDLFAQNESNVTLYDAQGQSLFTQDFDRPLATTMGDVDGDGHEDFVTFARNEGVYQVTLWSGLKQAWHASVREWSNPARAAVIRYKEGTQVVVGGTNGELMGISARGEELWRAQIGGTSGEGTRALSDVRSQGGFVLAAANRDGAVALIDAQGKVIWTYAYPDQLRRLRAFDVTGDGQDDILLGGEANRLIVLNGPDGKVLLDKELGQILTEIRDGELDGNPSTREFVVGGKEGGLWALRVDGSEVWSKTFSDKITDVATFDVTGDGAAETFAGDASGTVAMFAGRSGERYGLASRGTEIAGLEVERLGGVPRLVVADQVGVQLFGVTQEAAPFFYSPLVGGLILALAIAVAAWFVATLPVKPTLEVAITTQSVEGLQSRIRMLHDSLADLDRVKEAGELAPEAYLLRAKELRTQMAEAETALRQAGATFRPETFKCPNCGGILPQGLDKCDYCGQVVIR